MEIKLRTTKIKYKNEDQSVQINDGYKTQYFILNTMLSLNIINSILFPFFVLEKDKLSMSWFIWLIVGGVSVALLLFQITRKSAAENLKVDEIISLEDKNFLGRETLSLKLKNGKFRDLIKVKSEQERQEIKSFFKNLGLEV